MREWLLWRSLLWCLLLLPLWARSDVAPPPAEFWDYLAEFGDKDGDLFDPFDLTEASNIVRPAAEPPSNGGDSTSQQQEEQAP